jgi:hypothetical protein
MLVVVVVWLLAFVVSCEAVSPQSLPVPEEHIQGMVSSVSLPFCLYVGLER